MLKYLAAAVLAALMCGFAASQPEPVPVPCAPAKLECVLAEGAQLDGAAGFAVPFTYNGQGGVRCVIISAKNAGVVFGASPAEPVALFPGLYAAEFRGQTNADVFVYGYVPGTQINSNTVKAKIVGNMSP